MNKTELRAIRQRMGLTQTEFAARLRMNQGSVSRMESGKMIVTPPMELLIEMVAREARVEVAHAARGRRDDSPKQAKGAGIADSKDQGRRRPRKNSLHRGRR